MGKRGKNVKCTEDATSAIEIAVSAFEELKDEMGEWRDNMEEKLSHTDKYERVSEAADSLEEVHSNTEDALSTVSSNIDKLDLGTETKAIYFEYVPYGRKSASRADRMSNATAALESGIDALEGMVSELNEDTIRKDSEANADALVEVREALDELRNQIDEANSIEFPGMYG